MARVCLNMIVKNESAIIEKCLGAMAGHLDAAVIVDTGSTDDTIARIKGFCAAHDIPCEVPEIVFENFEQARNAALQAARTSSLDFDYLLLTDADMVMEAENASWKEGLEAPFYRVEQYTPALSYHNTRLVRRDVDCRYVGVTHEYLDCPGQGAVLNGMRFYDTASGANRVHKYERDIRLLTEALAGELDDDLRSRYMFYLGQTYHDIDRYEEAVEAYYERVAIGGWAEETFYALYRIGMCFKYWAKDAPEKRVDMVAAFLDAWSFRPSRVEPLYQLASYYREREEYETAYMFASRACEASLPSDMLFVPYTIYSARRWDELSVAAYWTGRYVVALEAAKTALKAEGMPEGFYARVRENRDHALRKLAED